MPQDEWVAYGDCSPDADEWDIEPIPDDPDDWRSEREDE